MLAHVLDSRDLSKSFHVTKGVKQGCVLAPNLFSLMFPAMLKDASCGSTVSVCVRNRTDDKVFNLRSIKAKTTFQRDTVRNLLFADDCALYAGSQSDMQQSMDLCSITLV